MIDLPLLAGDTCFQPTPFSTELFRFLGALGLDDGLISSLEKYNFAETKRYGFVHTMYSQPHPMLPFTWSPRLTAFSVPALTPETTGKARVSRLHDGNTGCQLTWALVGYPGLARTLNDLGLASGNDTPVDVDFVVWKPGPSALTVKNISPVNYSHPMCPVCSVRHWGA